MHRRKNWKKIILFVIFLLIMLSLIHGLSKLSDQEDMFNLAKKRARNTGKKLLVIGDPNEGTLNGIINGYDCGDICLDIKGCRNCKHDVIIIKGRLEENLPHFRNNSVVIFESETLEYIDKQSMEYVIKELYRISNGDIFTVHAQSGNAVLVKYINFFYTIFNKFKGTSVVPVRRRFTTYPPYGNFEYIDV